MVTCPAKAVSLPSGPPAAMPPRISCWMSCSALTGAPVTGSTQNLALTVYQRVVPVTASIVDGSMPSIGIFLGMATLVHGTVCSK